MNYERAQQIEALGGIVAGFTTRSGGVSTGPFASLNLSFSSGDSRAVVTENRRILAEPLGFSLDQIAIAGLVHSSRVAVVTEPGLVADVDALVTARSDILLYLRAADCAIVLLADAESRIVGACHAGWRGAAGGIVGATIAEMQSLGTAPAAIHAFISPCISTESFEVGPEVAVQFDADFVFTNSSSGKQHVDLKGAITRQLVTAGVNEELIEVHPECTFRNTRKYFSYRAEKANTGRMMGFIGMRD